MKMTKLWMLVLTMVLFLAACSSGNADSKEAEDEGSVKGDLEFYTSQPDTDATELVKKFNEKYPDVNVKIFRSGTEEVIGKLLAEKEAGAVQADVLLVADSVTFENLKEQDLLAPYESPEHDEHSGRVCRCGSYVCRNKSNVNDY